jgi:homoserine kinase type II
MAVYTELAPDEIAAVLSAYGLPAPARVVPEPRGYVNTNHHVWAGGSRFFLRLAEASGDEDVAFEAEVLRFLGEARFPAPRLLHTAGGAPAARVRGKHALLFAYAPGEELLPGAVAAEHCRRVGAELGRLHDLASGFTSARANPYGLARVAAWLAEVRGDPAEAEVRAALPLLEDELARAAALPGAPRGLVHGDLFVDNVLWIGGRVSAVLDWEMSCVEALVYDLAVALSAWCWEEGPRGAGPGLVAARVAALAAGYRERRRLEPETAAALLPFARFAALRFTASRLAALRAPDLGRARAPRKDWRPYRDQLLALRALAEVDLAAMLGA